MIAFFAVLISVSLGILTGIDEVRNGIILSFIIHWLLFIPAFIFKTEKFYDLTGTISYISIVLYVLLSSSNGISNFGNIIVSSLASKQLTRFVFNYENSSIHYLENIPIGKRIRDIIPLKNGKIALLTDITESNEISIENHAEIILLDNADN